MLQKSGFLQVELDTWSYVSPFSKTESRISERILPVSIVGDLTPPILERYAGKSWK